MVKCPFCNIEMEEKKKTMVFEIDNEKKLKTFKDLEKSYEKIVTSSGIFMPIITDKYFAPPTIVFSYDLRQSAIEWIKKLEKDKGKEERTFLPSFGKFDEESIIMWIKHFFNLFEKTKKEFGSPYFEIACIDVKCEDGNIYALFTWS